MSETTRILLQALRLVGEILAAAPLDGDPFAVMGAAFHRGFTFLAGERETLEKISHEEKMDLAKKGDKLKKTVVKLFKDHGVDTSWA